MPRSRTDSALRALVAWLTLSIGLVSLPSAALCVGEDGHLAIEVVGSACGPFDPAEHRVAADGDDPSLHGCVDTSLGALGLKEAPQVWTPAQNAHWSAPLGDPAAPSRAAACAFDATCAAHLRSVVLRL